MPPRDEPFIQLVKSVMAKRKATALDAAKGQWRSEAEAREIVGRFQAYEEILEEMRTIAGPGSHFGETDIV